MATTTLQQPRTSHVMQHGLYREIVCFVESAAHVLAGLTCFLLLPLFHFQLFFFLLESMGGNGFVACLCWALVPSVTTRWGDRLKALNLVRWGSNIGYAVPTSVLSKPLSRGYTYEQSDDQILRSIVLEHQPKQKPGVLAGQEQVVYPQSTARYTVCAPVRHGGFARTWPHLARFSPLHLLLYCCFCCLLWGTYSQYNCAAFVILILSAIRTYSYHSQDSAVRRTYTAVSHCLYSAAGRRIRSRDYGLWRGS